jgi:hypothetical protein
MGSLAAGEPNGTRRGSIVTIQSGQQASGLGSRLQNLNQNPLCEINLN